MKHHPEQLEDEIYMGNCTPRDTARSSWATGRLGKLTLNAKEESCDPFTAQAIKPWFIKLAEVEQAIATERELSKPWSAEKIRALQPLVDHRTAFFENK